jgi:hypothetical protein
LTFVAEAEHIGERLDRFLTSQIPDHSRSQIQRLIEDGRVTHSRYTKVKANNDIREGDVIGVDLPEPEPSAAQAEDIPLEILFNDADVVVINKPAGMVVHPAAGNATGTLVNALLHHVKDLSGIGGEVRPGIGWTRARRASWSWRRTMRRTRSWRASSTIARSRRNTWPWRGASCISASASTPPLAATPTIA